MIDRSYLKHSKYLYGCLIISGFAIRRMIRLILLMDWGSLSVGRFCYEHSND